METQFNKQCIVHLIATLRQEANAFLEAQLRNVGNCDLQPIHGELLALLYASGKPVQMKEIPACIGRSKSTVNSLVETLERKGWIVRIACVHDARCTYLDLTEKGREFEPVFRRISSDLQEQAWKDFTEEESQILIMLLNKMKSNYHR